MDYPSDFKLKLTIEYEGTNFWGWQIQPQRETIQKVVEETLKIFINAEFKKQGIEAFVGRIKVKASGRTDRGVHALGQVLSFAWPAALKLDSFRMMGALNGISPREIAFLDCEIVPTSFDAQYSAISKHYRYKISRRLAPLCLDHERAWRIMDELSLNLLELGLNNLIGTHDFASFRASDCVARTTIRTIEDAYLDELRNGMIEINFIGTGFLKNMVRYTVAILVEIARKKKEVSYINSLLNLETRDPHIKLAPACGLYLVKVNYPDLKHS